MRTRIERHAWQIVEHEHEAATPAGVLAGELFVVLTHLDRTRRLFAQLERELNESVGRVGSEVVQVERLLSRTSPVRSDLLGKLLALQAEQRRLAIQKEQLIRPLIDHVAGLLAKYAFVVDE